MKTEAALQATVEKEAYSATSYLAEGDAEDQRTEHTLSARAKEWEKSGGSLPPYDAHIQLAIMRGEGPQRMARQYDLDATEFGGRVMYEKVKLLHENGNSSDSKYYQVPEGPLAELLAQAGGYGRLEEAHQDLERVGRDAREGESDADAAVRFRAVQDLDRYGKLTRAFEGTNPAGGEQYSGLVGTPSGRLELNKLRKGAPSSLIDYADLFASKREFAIRRALEQGMDETETGKIKLSFDLQAKGFADQAIADGNFEAARKLLETLGWGAAYVEAAEKQQKEKAVVKEAVKAVEDSRPAKERVKREKVKVLRAEAVDAAQTLDASSIKDALRTDAETVRTEIGQLEKDIPEYEATLKKVEPKSWIDAASSWMASWVVSEPQDIQEAREHLKAARVRLPILRAQLEKIESKLK